MRLWSFMLSDSTGGRLVAMMGSEQEAMHCRRL